MHRPLSHLGIIGNRRTLAVVARDATILWYSPQRVDRPSIFCELLSGGKGAWRVLLPAGVPARRQYLGDNAILETDIATPAGVLHVTDWMTMGMGTRPGLLCREFGNAPAPAVISFDAWKGYGRCRSRPTKVGNAVVFDDGLHLFASHSLWIDGKGVHWALPAGESGWTALADGPCDPPRSGDLVNWRHATSARWRELAATTSYAGPHSTAVAASLRQLRLLVYEPTGAIAASATLGLPEVLGGKRNYDYRYAWLRDSAMVVRAMLRTAKAAHEGEAFLAFIAMSAEHAHHHPLDAVVTVDGYPVPCEVNPPLDGYAASSPVRVGNRAGDQLQIDALGNFLLAAAMVYRERHTRDHWVSVESVADFLASHWRAPDSGMWESPTRRQYTSSKVLAACGLDGIAPFATPERSRRYRRAAADIRAFVYRHCLTREGAFAAFRGCERVDISAALFPVWSFCRADAPEMTASMRVLEREDARGGLFVREDETPQSASEGAFLPGTFWAAQYWAARDDRARAERYFESGIAHANDLGILPEEVDWATGAALGNVPLAMAHASLLNAAADIAELQC